MKVIFLDIDGVVNCSDTKERSPTKVIGVEQSKIALIKQIVDATGAKLILSSTWRIGWFYEETGSHDRDIQDWHYLRDEFFKQGLWFFDYTPLDKNRHRGTEIQIWLDKWEDEVDAYAVIDDSMYDIWEMHKGHLVQTSYDHGIQQGAVDMAIKILNKNDEKQSE